MKKWKLPAILLGLSLILLTAAGAAGRDRPVLVAVRCSLPTATVHDETGQVLQTLEFDRSGQAAAGPLAPGPYTLRCAWGETAFTVRSNGGVCQVEGTGWTDGELLHISRRTTGTLTVLYEGAWRWSLKGERAGEAVPSMESGTCRFSHLPLGWYVLTGPGEDVAVLLTEDDSDQTVRLPK